ncbi:MAG: RadC family protein [Athalassotoga sp.]|uniref:RadC family protein n=1 Tax=Athalassotoga sp. TaxID=2022597 RepID=UPI003CFC8341
MVTDFSHSETPVYLSDMEKPRERALKRGIETLSDAELVSILLRTGTKGKNFLEVAEELLNKFDNSFVKMKNASFEELFDSALGIGEAKSLAIKAALEIGNRMWKESLREKKFLKSAEDVYDFCKDMVLATVEQVRVIALDSQLGIIAVKDLTVGTANASLIHPREIFGMAIRYPSSGVIVIHNHPSGNPAPSKEDDEATHRIKEAGEVIGIKLIDHVIVASQGFYSFSKMSKI